MQISPAIVSDRSAISRAGSFVALSSARAAAIGSGGPYAFAAARALLGATKLSAREIAERALGIAGEICIYTNGVLVFEELGA